MTQNTPPRRPKAFTLPQEPNSPSEATNSKKAQRKPRAIAPEHLIMEEDVFANEIILDDTTLENTEILGSKRRFSWSTLALAALGMLFSLAAGLAIDQLVRDLFIRAPWLGWLALALTAVFIASILAIVFREILALKRLRTIERLRLLANEAYNEDSKDKANTLASKLINIYANRADMARGRATLDSFSSDIIDTKDMLKLMETSVLEPLDSKANSLIMGSAQRVSVVTALSPRAFVDIAFVLMENIRLIRKIAELYGGKPGVLGFWRLMRAVIAHLAVTGAVAVGDNIIQQLVGHGLAARLSARLGEGVVNGLLTARIGLSAMDICRPIPFTQTKRPSINGFFKALLKSQPKAAKDT